MTEDFKNSKRFVTWHELQEEYAKRDALKKANREKIYRFIGGLIPVLIVLGLVVYANLIGK